MKTKSDKLNDQLSKLVDKMEKDHDVPREQIYAIIDLTIAFARAERRESRPLPRTLV